MKKITLLLGAALIMGTAAFAGDGNKGGCCSKGKKEHCSSAKKEGDKKSTSAHADTKKAESKETKAEAVKKS